MQVLACSPGLLVQSDAPLALDDYSASVYIQANHCTGTIHTLETALMHGLHLT